MAVSHVERQRCAGCGKFVAPRREADDWEAEERAYHADVDQLDDHDCPALEEHGPARPTVARALRKERTRSAVRKASTRLRKHTCGCTPARIVRAATDDLTDVVCQRCGMYFCWQPSPSELSDDELAGRVPA